MKIDISKNTYFNISNEKEILKIIAKNRNANFAWIVNNIYDDRIHYDDDKDSYKNGIVFVIYEKDNQYRVFDLITEESHQTLNIGLTRNAWMKLSIEDAIEVINFEYDMKL